jgi:hypothetical protein
VEGGTWLAMGGMRWEVGLRTACDSINGHIDNMVVMIGQKQKNIQQAGFPDGHPL